MLRFIFRRLMQLVLVVFVLSLLLFLWLRALPGGIVSAMLGERATPESRARLTHELGLDEPIWVQYWTFLKRAVTGDFGVSNGVQPGKPAMELLLDRFPATIELSVLALVIAIGLALPLGYLAAKRHGSMLDNLSVVGSLVGVAVPVFFLAFLLRYLFAQELHWLPVSGRQEVDATRVTGFFVLDGLLTREWDAAWDALKHLLLPAIALASIPFAMIFRITRASVLEVLDEDYVRTAESKGLTQRVVRGRHVMRNALLPVITAIGLQMGGLLAGAVLTESVFNLAGIGDALRQAFSLRDYPVLQVLILAAACTYVLVNLLVDILYAVVDPPSEDPMNSRRKQRIDALAASSGTTTVAEAGHIKDTGGVGLVASAWRRLRRNPIFLIGLAITIAFIVLAVIAPWIAPHDPADNPLIDKVSPQSNPIPGPEPGYPLGADSSGRDFLSRLIVGSRQTLIVGVAATIGGLGGGLVLGTLSGAFGGAVDAVIMRVVDVMLSIPSLLLAFSIAAIAARPSQWTVIIAIAVVQVPIFARLLRGSMLAQRSKDHVLAARALGVRRSAIVLRHMLPNSLGPVIVQTTLVLATAIIDAAALSYLGLGLPDDRVPEWGQMLGTSETYFQDHPHLAVYPALCIIVVALGFTLMGESLREALDPKSRR